LPQPLLLPPPDQPSATPPPAKTPTVASIAARRITLPIIRSPSLSPSRAAVRSGIVSNDATPLFRLEQGERVSLRILEPRGLADPDRGRDMVDGLEHRKVVFLEGHAAGRELLDIRFDIRRPEADLRVIGLARPGPPVDEQ